MLPFRSIGQELKLELKRMGKISIIVYDEEYPDRIELEIEISLDDPNPELTIRESLLNYFGYGERRESWERSYELRKSLGMFRVMYMGADYELNEFLRLLGDIVKEIQREEVAVPYLPSNIELLPLKTGNWYLGYDTVNDTYIFWNKKTKKVRPAFLGGLYIHRVTRKPDNTYEIVWFHEATGKIIYTVVDENFRVIKSGQREKRRKKKSRRRG